MRKILPFISILLVVFISCCLETPTGMFISSERISCTPRWDCSDWTECNLENGRWAKIRVCVDLNGCGTDLYKPSESLDCEPPIFYEVKMGETFSQCSLNVMIDSATISKKLTYKNLNGEMVPLFSDAGKNFVIVSAEIENDFKDSIYTGSLDFYLIDQDNKSYEPKCPIDVFDECIASEDWYLYPNYILSGEKSKGYLLFSIPDDTLEIQIIYDVPYVSYDCNGVDYLYWKV